MNTIERHFAGPAVVTPVEYERGVIPETATQMEILAVLGRRIESYLEIGVQEGRSLAVVLNAAGGKFRLLALCDDWGTRSGGTGRGNHSHIRTMISQMGAKIDEILWLDGRSQDLLPRILPTRAEGFQLVHVDGEHSHEACSFDMETGWRLLAPGGTMVVHDIDMEGPRFALKGFLQYANSVDIQIFTGGHHTAVLRKELPV